MDLAKLKETMSGDGEKSKPKHSKSACFRDFANALKAGKMAEAEAAFVAYQEYDDEEEYED